MSPAAIGRAGRRTRRCASTRLAMALGLVLALGAPSAQAASFGDTARAALSVAEDAFDLVVLRPAGILALTAGSVFFVATVPAVAPYHAAKGSIDGLRASYDVFVYPPYDYTFLRDLGDF